MILIKIYYGNENPVKRHWPSTTGKDNMGGAKDDIISLHCSLGKANHNLTRINTEQKVKEISWWLTWGPTIGI